MPKIAKYDIFGPKINILKNLNVQGTFWICVSKQIFYKKYYSSFFLFDID